MAPRSTAWREVDVAFSNPSCSSGDRQCASTIVIAVAQASPRRRRVVVSSW
jgi:hypothetical protein